VVVIELYNCRSSWRPPVEVSYRPQVDDVQDDGDRMLPSPASLYGPSLDVVINARPDDADGRHLGAAVGGLPSMLVYVGIPDLKPSHTQRFTYDSPSPSRTDVTETRNGGTLLPP